MRRGGARSGKGLGESRQVLQKLRASANARGLALFVLILIEVGEDERAGSLFRPADVPAETMRLIEAAVGFARKSCSGLAVRFPAVSARGHFDDLFGLLDGMGGDGKLAVHQLAQENRLLERRNFQRRGITVT